MFVEGAPAEKAECFLALLTYQHSAPLLWPCTLELPFSVVGDLEGEVGLQGQSLTPGAPSLSPEIFSCSCGRVYHNVFPEW